MKSFCEEQTQRGLRKFLAGGKSIELKTDDMKFKAMDDPTIRKTRIVDDKIEQWLNNLESQYRNTPSKFGNDAKTIILRGDTPRIIRAIRMALGIEKGE